MTGPRLFEIRGVDLRTSSRILVRPPLAAAQMQSQALPTRLPDLTGAPPAVQRQLVDSLVVMFAIDGSGSVHGPHGTDPYGARNAACRSVVDLMHRYGGGRAGVVHWGQRAPADLALPPMPVRSGRLRRGLAMQPMLGGTNPAAALARVHQLVPMVSAGQTLVVLLLTDGQDLGDGLAGQLAQLPPASVHLLLVDPSGNCYGRETAWHTLPWGSFTRLADLHDPQRVAWESGAVIARSIGLDLAGQAHS
jgi:hypothetical protein